MERAHYRRYTPSKMHTITSIPERIADGSAYQVQQVQPAGAETGGVIEKLIVQGIISGIILAAVLILSFTNHPQASDILTNLSQAISGHISAEHVAAEVRRFLGEETPNLMRGPVYTEAPVTDRPQILTTPRIDEEILQEVLGIRDGSDLQTTAPEPIVLPEL